MTSYVSCVFADPKMLLSGGLAGRLRNAARCEHQAQVISEAEEQHRNCGSLTHSHVRFP